MLGGSVSSGFFDRNEAWHSGGGSTSVCEHTYRHVGGASVSRRCAAGDVTSLCDLDGDYLAGRQLTGHAGNNSNNQAKIWGYTYTVSPCVNA